MKAARKGYVYVVGAPFEPSAKSARSKTGHAIDVSRKRHEPIVTPAAVLVERFASRLDFYEQPECGHEACEILNCRPNGDRGLVADYCRKSGEFRGWILPELATAIRSMNDCRGRMRGLLAYLKRPLTKFIWSKNWQYTDAGIKFLASRQHCDVCGSTDKLCIDHCHESGLVRGVLCDGCNSAEGHFAAAVAGDPLWSQLGPEVAINLAGQYLEHSIRWGREGNLARRVDV